MARRRVAEITKRAPGTGEGVAYDFSDLLRNEITGLQGAEISSVVAVAIEKRVATDPEAWDDVTDQWQTPAATTIENGKSYTRAVVKVLHKLDEDATPPADGVYQVVIEVLLSNGQGEVGVAPMRIVPTASVT